MPRSSAAIQGGPGNRLRENSREDGCPVHVLPGVKAVVRRAARRPPEKVSALVVTDGRGRHARRRSISATTLSRSLNVGTTTVSSGFKSRVGSGSFAGRGGFLGSASSRMDSHPELPSTRIERTSAKILLVLERPAEQGVSFRGRTIAGDGCARVSPPCRRPPAVP